MAQAGTSAAGAAAGNAVAGGLKGLTVGWVLKLMGASPASADGVETNIITPDDFSSALLTPVLTNTANGLFFREKDGEDALRVLLKDARKDELMDKLMRFSDGLGYFDWFPLARGTCYEFQWRRYEELLKIWRWSTPEEANMKRRVLCNACTGSGKSGIIAMAPFAGAHNRVLVVVPNLTLLEQMTSTLVDGVDQSSAFLSSRGCMAGNPMPTTFILDSRMKLEDILPNVLKANVVITNIQCIQALKRQPKGTKGTKRNADGSVAGLEALGRVPQPPQRERLDLLKNKAEADGKPLFDLIVFDEAHHMIKAQTWKHTWASLGEPWPEVKMLATTATPFNSEEQKVESDYDLRPFTLLDGISVTPTVTKNVVFLSMDLNAGVNGGTNTVTQVGSHRMRLYV